MDQRDHLFISYATEDGDLAEWLTVKLTAEGYAVWCDRVKLLGGESYPQDIDAAIKNRTFRVLHLLSRASLDKPNPVGERTLALIIGRERKVDFLIPLNVDGIRPSELNWMTASLTFIPFDRSWAAGFAQLLKKLTSVEAPRALAGSGSELIREWHERRDAPDVIDERLTSNRLAFEHVPAVVFRLFSDGDVPDWPAGWPAYEQADNVRWSFGIPPGWERSDFVSVHASDWRNEDEIAGVRTANVVINLLRQHLRHYCLARGLVETNKGQLYFPTGLLPGERLAYTTSSGRPSHVLSTGLRTFRSSAGETRKARYALAPRFWVSRTADARHTVELQVRVEVMMPEGGFLEPAIAQRRRKRITKSWFNHEWRTRVLAICRWLGEGADRVDVGRTVGIPITLGTVPLSHAVDRGIDELALAQRKGVSMPAEHDGQDEDDGVVLADADVYDEDEV